ncbi:MAG: prepilin-type N-terminal cleavage/methylation domain-containing protein [Planctomycetes bacterium]|nr:prepilin-type N-terminal cleavage/methylation domain-containing protein [Planctomycetota bacterium]
MKRSDNKNRSGFTLIEALIATVLIGIAIAALVTSNISHTQANAYGMHTSTAEFLIEEIKAMTMPLEVTDPNSGTSVYGPEADEIAVTDYDDLDDFDGVTFNPPVDVNGNVLSDFSEYSQVVIVENLDPGDFTNVVADHGSAIVRVSVSVEMNGKEISSTNWIRAQQ